MLIHNIPTKLIWQLMNFHGVDYEKYFLRTIYVSINKSETRTILKTKKVDIYKKKLRKEYMRCCCCCGVSTDYCSLTQAKVAVFFSFSFSLSFSNGHKKWKMLLKLYPIFISLQGTFSLSFLSPHFCSFSLSSLT